MQGNHGLIGNDAGSKFATMTSLAKVCIITMDFKFLRLLTIQYHHQAKFLSKSQMILRLHQQAVLVERT